MDENLRVMLVGLAKAVHENFPDQAPILRNAIGRARREGASLENVSGFTRDLDGALLGEGDRIIALLARADREMPDDVAELEAAVLRILDPDT